MLRSELVSDSRPDEIDVFVLVTAASHFDCDGHLAQL
jgi:hypothetical protein